MTGTCRFLDEEGYYEGTLARALEIKCEDGFTGVILVTRGEEVLGTKPAHNIWHYEISPDGTKITLKNFKHSSSVDFLDGKHHITVENWPLLP